ncbi:SCO family protein [Castellaniella hirudinis]|uniref:SCO family protein n=1 Tax=Castellaniella hirudinis TaxID=1144617 RepID=UPI0039C04390
MARRAPGGSAPLPPPRRPGRRAARWLAAGLLCWLLSPGLAGATVHPVRGFLPDLKFSLQGAGGVAVTQQDFRGKVVLLFFGYASCPDICPTTMAQLAQLTESLGPRADQVRIVFISVDPHRDTPDILQAYVDLFDPRAIGLTGDETAIADLARRYRVAYQIEKPRPGEADSAYEVAHSRGIYAFDQAGKAVWLASDGESQDDLRAALDPLLD